MVTGRDGSHSRNAPPRHPATNWPSPASHTASSPWFLPRDVVAFSSYLHPIEAIIHLMGEAHKLPPIIQGGMGIGVSGWRLARAVSQCGQLGVVSGTALDSVLVRRLQDGDFGGHLRRAMAMFPIPGIAADVLRRYFRPQG